MVDGLAWPLYGIPLLAFFLGFVVLAPRPWARLELTITGLRALGWSAWWLQDDLVWWLGAGLYIARLPDPVDPGRQPVVPAAGPAGCRPAQPARQRSRSRRRSASSSTASVLQNAQRTYGRPASTRS